MTNSQLNTHITRVAIAATMLFVGCGPPLVVIIHDHGDEGGGDGDGDGDGDRDPDDTGAYTDAPDDLPVVADLPDTGDGDGDGDPTGGCEGTVATAWCPCYDGDLDGDGVATVGGECFSGLVCDADSGICLPDS